MSNIYRFWHPFNPFFWFKSVGNYSVSNLFYYKMSIFKFGKYPNILVVVNKLLLKFNSIKEGNYEWLKTSSKSLNSQWFKSNSAIVDACSPYNF